MKQVLLPILLLSAVAGCGGPGQQGDAGHEDAAEETSTDSLAEYTIAVVPKGLVHQFWQTVRAGAESAGREFGAKIIWNGPPRETEVERQISIIEDMINRNVDALVMAACHETALADVLEKAKSRGIPVVTIDSGVKSGVPVTHVATDNIAGAKAAADKLAELVGKEGAVGIIPFVRGAATSDLRERGFLDAMKSYPGLTVVPPRYSESDVAKGMAAMEDMMTAHPDLAGVFAANEAGAIGAAAALQASGKAGAVKLVAFDASPEEVSLLEEGVIQALIVQNPFGMGYEGVKAAVDHLEGKEIPARIDTGVVVVTANTLDSPEVQKLLAPEEQLRSAGL